MRKMKRYLTILIILAVFSGCKPKAGSKDDPDIVTSETKIDHLLIWEVFYTGNWRTIKSFNGKERGYVDQKPMYIKIFNPTEEPKYLDGLCIATSHHDTTNFTEIKFESPEQNFFKTNFAVDEILQFPGTGKEYVIKPGETVLIAKMAVDFTQENPNSGEDGNPNSLDLSKASFEWYSTPDQFDFEDCEDNPNVPNLKRNFFDEDNAGLDPTNRTLVLFEIKDTEFFNKLQKEDSSYYKQYSYTFVGHHGDVYDQEASTPTLPNEWIIDAVSISPIDAYKMRTIAEELDEGWFGVSRGVVKASEMQKEDTGKAIRRKWNGKRYEDTNNSSVDFEVVPASLETAAERQPKSAQ